MEINIEQKEILKHTIKNGEFCGDSLDMDFLCKQGFMEYIGKKPFVPDGYYKITDEGKKLIEGKLVRTKRIELYEHHDSSKELIIRFDNNYNVAASFKKCNTVEDTIRTLKGLINEIERAVVR